MVLRDIRDEDGTRYLDAVIESDGTLRITGHDQSPGVSQVFGPNITPYEWVYVVAPDRLPALTGELGGTAGDDVLTLLQAHHDGEPGGLMLDAILRSPSIDTQFDNWHGSADADPAEEASCEPVDAGSTRAEEAPVQAEPGASSTARAEPSVTTEGERGEPVTDNELPPELIALLQLDPYERGNVSSELAARVCGWDRAWSSVSFMTRRSKSSSGGTR